MELAHLKSFLTVARKGNLSTAAKELNATQPNLGRQMTALSKEVGMDLFVRHSRGLILTQQGKEFFELCQRIVGELEQETAVIRDKDSEPQGTLKIVTGIGTSDTILAQLPLFARQFPKLDFSFLSTTDIYQFQIGEADVGIVPVAYSDPDIVQHLLFESFLRLYASPQYLALYSRPTSFSDLKRHKLIVYISSERSLEKINIHLQSKNHNIHPFIKVNNGISLRRSLVEGLGIGPYGYDRDLVENNILVDVFPDMPDHKIPYYYTYHRRLAGSPKIIAFHEFLKQIVKVWEKPS